MIHVIPIDDFDPALVGKICRLLYQTFGIGCEPADAPVAGHKAPRGKPLDAQAFLEQATSEGLLADDKVLYLTTRPLADRELPSGKVPTQGLALPSKGRAVVSAHGLPTGEAFIKRLAKHSVHEMGRLWGLHHCIDPRCAMYVTWSPPFLAAEQPLLCPFCRDKSDERIRQAKS